VFPTAASIDSELPGECFIGLDVLELIDILHGSLTTNQARGATVDHTHLLRSRVTPSNGYLRTYSQNVKELIDIHLQLKLAKADMIVPGSLLSIDWIDVDRSSPPRP
jgi:hypothetical protein